MAVIAIAGQPGCRVDQLARLAAQRLQLELITESKLRQLVTEEFGSETAIPHKAFPHAITYIVAQLARQHHLCLAAPGAEMIVHRFPASLRVGVVASEAFRLGNVMLDDHLDRNAARALMAHLEGQQKQSMKRCFGRTTVPAERYDLVANAETLEPDQIVDMLEGAAYVRGLLRHGLLPEQVEAELQFEMRMEFSRHGLHPAGKAAIVSKPFAHRSEQIFANLLDFYRIAWEYEPKSFPVEWDKNGTPIESFTPDFYLPELNLYVELTTMKQAHVTRKNRKVKRLRSLYPSINIQVFYQKDFQNLVFKHGLSEQVLAT
jgi:cytidylate kinase